MIKIFNYSRFYIFHCTYSTARIGEFFHCVNVTEKYFLSRNLNLCKPFEVRNRSEAKRVGNLKGPGGYFLIAIVLLLLIKRAR